MKHRVSAFLERDFARDLHDDDILHDPLFKLHANCSLHLRCHLRAMTNVPFAPQMQIGAPQTMNINVWKIRDATLLSDTERYVFETLHHGLAPQRTSTCINPGMDILAPVFSLWRTNFKA